MKIAILGSTGSVGLQTIDVCRRLQPKQEIAVLAARRNVDAVMAQVTEFGASHVVFADKKAWKKASESQTNVNVLFGEEGLEEALEKTSPDVTVNSIWGTAGLQATLAALKYSKRLALANKESLVSAGQLVMSKAKETGCEILPVDSEQSAIMQAMASGRHSEIRRVLLTASGGPFLDWSSERMAKARPEDALKHPTWAMGRGITVDSATLMNKAFEIIETKWLFDLEPALIEVVIHPESIVHSLVEFMDGSCIAQMSVTDMRIPIQYALTYPDRLQLDLKPLELHEIGKLTFRKPDSKRFRALVLARQVMELGGTAGATLVSANQRASAAFLDGKIGFNRICEVTAKVIGALSVVANPSLEDIISTHEWSQAEADRWISQES